MVDWSLGGMVLGLRGANLWIGKHFTGGGEDGIDDGEVTVSGD